MDDQAGEQQVIKSNNMEKESVSIETSDLATSKRNNLFLKLKISNNTLKRCGQQQQQQQQHICPVCSKGFSSGKALGGHIRIHMKDNKINNGRHRKISKLQYPKSIHHRSKAKKKQQMKKLVLPKSAAAAAVKVINQEEKVSCCICHKDFRSMKSLFGHMRNHPERSWRGIRPPPPPLNSDKNSCCSSVSENDDDDDDEEEEEEEEEEALEQVLVDDQISTCTAADDQKSLVYSSGSDLLKSLPKWTMTKINNTTTSKRCGKSTSPDHHDLDNEISQAAYSLMQLARSRVYPSDLVQDTSVVGFGYNQRKYSSSTEAAAMGTDHHHDNSRSSGLAIKGSSEVEKKRINVVLGKEINEGKGKASFDYHQEGSSGPSDSYRAGAADKQEMINCVVFVDRRRNAKTMKLNHAAAADGENNNGFDQVHNHEVEDYDYDHDDDPLSTEENRCISGRRRKRRRRMSPSCETPDKISSGEGEGGGGDAVEAPISPEELDKSLYSETVPFATSEEAAETQQVSLAPRMLDFDLNQPYLGLDDDDYEATTPPTLT